MKTIYAALCLAGVLGVTGVHAKTISSYDVTNALPSGYGYWTHTYNGTITDAGNDLLNYNGGTGTLTDGLISGTYLNTQLFGTEEKSTITLHFADASTIGSIDLYGNTDPTSFITGTINRVKVTIGDTSAYINTVPFGPECEFDKCYDKLVLTGTVLAGLSTDKVVLSDFSVLNADYNNYYALGEITVDALPYTGPGPDTSPVPEPSTYAMLLAGLGLTGAIARHRARRQG